MLQSTPLKIIHCIRAPVGGVYRHVADLATAQNAAGHSVGLICDSTTGGAFEDDAIAALAPALKLGVTRIAMSRSISPMDAVSAWRVARQVRQTPPDVLHAHGAKGGVFARLVGALLHLQGHRTIRLYCPHGGSLHYHPKSLQGRVYFAAERLLERATDGLVFVSKFEADTYVAKIGMPKTAHRIIHNGLRSEEFEPVVPNEDAADFLFIGALRHLKGPDVIIDALRKIADRGEKTLSAVIVGAGEEKAALVAQARDLGLADAIRFEEPMTAREAFRLARCVLLPSRAESLPYIVLEAIAAQRPVITTNVGGIPEIYGAESDRLVPPGDAEALATAMEAYLEAPTAAEAVAQAHARRLKDRFSLKVMAGEVERFYRDLRQASSNKNAPTAAMPAENARTSSLS